MLDRVIFQNLGVGLLLDFGFRVKLEREWALGLTLGRGLRVKLRGKGLGLEFTNGFSPMIGV